MDIIRRKKTYPSDLKDKQWKTAGPLFVGSRVRRWSKRGLLNAALYVVKSGCQWRMTPDSFPPRQTVCSFYIRAVDKGLWDRITNRLVTLSRTKAGRKPKPTYALPDSQSVKTTGCGYGHGYDGGKKVKGRKRHICAGTMGSLLHVRVHAANIHDTVAGVPVAEAAKKKYKTINNFCVDAGCRGNFVRKMKEMFGMDAGVSEKIKPHEWEKMPWRWVVERTFSWFNGSRRLSKDYECPQKR